MTKCIPVIMAALALSVTGCGQIKSMLFAEEASQEQVEQVPATDELTQVKNALATRTEELELLRSQLVETRRSVQQLEQVRAAAMKRLEVLKKERDALNAEVQVLRDANKPPVFQRDEFLNKIRGMTHQDLIKVVGKPVRSFGENSEWWYYNNVTCHPVSGELDANVQVIFTDGRVSGVTY